MGYDVHITRAIELSDSKDTPITIEEWLQYVQQDPEMRLDGYAKATTPKGDTLRIESEGLCVWKGYSGHGRDGNMAWFYYYDGCVIVKNPDDEILIKMKSIAESLAANVIGDEGEFY
jgi:hypothetical protein